MARAGHETADKANHRMHGLLEARLVSPLLQAMTGWNALRYLARSDCIEKRPALAQ